jgi:hypothetical protein
VPRRVLGPTEWHSSRCWKSVVDGGTETTGLPGMGVNRVTEEPRPRGRTKDPEHVQLRAAASTNSGMRAHAAGNCSIRHGPGTAFSRQRDI